MLAILDAKHRRSLLVLNGLSDVLAEMTLASEVNALLSESCAMPVFFVSYSLEKNSVADVTSRQQADDASLKRLKAFDELSRRVGVKRVAREVQRLTHQIYDRSIIPLLFSHLNQSSRQVAAAQKKLGADLESIRPEQLRIFAAHHVMQYLQIFRAALRGESGHALLHGETLPDEREQCGQPRTGWRISTRVSVTVPEVPGSGVRMLGRAAVARLLSDLTAAVAAAPLSDANTDRTLLANVGPAGSGRLPDFVFAAGDVAGKRARDVLRPLMTKAVERAAHIAKHVADAAEEALAQAQRSKTNEVISHAPFFGAAIRERVYEFVEAHARRCSQAVDDAFRSTAFLPVSLLRQLSPLVASDEAEELEKLGVLSNGMLDELKVGCSLQYCFIHIYIYIDILCFLGKIA